MTVRNFRIRRTPKSQSKSCHLATQLSKWFMDANHIRSSPMTAAFAHSQRRQSSIAKEPSPSSRFPRLSTSHAHTHTHTHTMRPRRAALRKSRLVFPQFATSGALHQRHAITARCDVIRSESCRRQVASPALRKCRVDLRLVLDCSRQPQASKAHCASPVLVDASADPNVDRNG
jgi:hypothetical protein